MEADYLFKVALVGNSAVGKSALLRRISDDKFEDSYLATIGVDFRFKTVSVGEHSVKLQIWDTAGQERFRTITSTYYKNAQAIVLVYDVSKPQSFEAIRDYWAQEIESNAEGDAEVMLLGNKTDLARRVPEQACLDLAGQRGWLSWQVSAKTGEYVDPALKALIGRLISRHPHGPDSLHQSVAVKIRLKRRELQLEGGGCQC
jgi:Ras-related protein Rab-1A